MIIQSFIVIAKTSQRNTAIYVIYVTKFSNKFDINCAKSYSHVISNFKQYFSVSTYIPYALNPGCDVINFEFNLILVIKPGFFT